MASLKDAGKYLSLAEAIETLKGELMQAELNAVRKGSRLFKLDEFEMELALEFAPKTGAEFNVYVFKVQVGAEAKGTHKIKLKFTPNRPVVAAALKDAAGEITLSPKVPARRAAKRRR